MANKPILVVVHGMGRHTEQSLRSEVETVLGDAYSLYPSLGGSLLDRFELFPVVYDSVFESYRESLRQRTGPLHNALQALGGNATPIAKATGAINAIDAALSRDSFSTTHLLDVVLYRYTMLAEPVQVHVARAINAAVVKAGAGNVHVLAHSLGTSVVHDALHKLYSPGGVPDGERSHIGLKPSSSRLGSVNMVANVSRALQHSQKVALSLVRPGERGCLHRYAQFQHKLDPIVRVEPFEPANDDRWVSDLEYRYKYHLDEPSEVLQANVHSLAHYLAIPSVHQYLFSLLFTFKLTKKENNAAHATFHRETASEKAAALREITVEPPGLTDDRVQRLLEAVSALQEMAAGFQEDFR